MESTRSRSTDDVVGNGADGDASARDGSIATSQADDRAKRLKNLRRSTPHLRCRPVTDHHKVVEHADVKRWSKLVPRQLHSNVQTTWPVLHVSPPTAHLSEPPYSPGQYSSAICCARSASRQPCRYMSR